LFCLTNLSCAFCCADSLCYHVRGADVYSVMKTNLSLFDTSGYPDDERGLKSTTNAKVVGKFKDECDGRAAREFVGLRAKMYSLAVGKVDDHPKMTAKGIKRSFVQHHVKHEMYLHTLKSKTITKAKFRTFRSDKHNVHTIELTKACLSAFDDKRFILPDGISTLAYGHCDIGRVHF